jgi:hypothetical protein
MLIFTAVGPIEVGVLSRRRHTQTIGHWELMVHQRDLSRDRACRTFRLFPGHGPREPPLQPVSIGFRYVQNDYVHQFLQSRGLLRKYNKRQWK